MSFETIDIGTVDNDGTGDTLRVAGTKINNNTAYLQALHVALKNPMGFDREGAITSLSTGILQYCHSASSGIVYQVGSDKDGAFSELTSQTTFADGSTALADRTVALYHDPTKASFSYWFEGELIEVTGIKTYQVPVSGANYLCFNSSGDLEIENDARTVIMHKALVALVYNNETDNIFFADERHGLVMDGHTHLNLHQTRGFKWAKAGGGCEVYGISNSATTFTKISESKYTDEDIRMSIPEITTAPFMYKNSSGFWVLTAEDDALGHTDSGDLQYNPVAGGLSNVSGGDYIIMSMWATNNKRYPIVKIIGQDIFTARGDARDRLSAYVTELSTDGLPAPEMIPFASYILHESDNGIYPGDNGELWIDCRCAFPVSKFDTLT